MSAVAVIGLGSSLGDRRAALELAVQALDALPGVRVCAASRVYLTPPMGAARGAFLNAALRVETTHSPRGLLRACKSIETRLGRLPSVRWGDRRIDLDVLLFGGRLTSGRGLRLPHPGLLQRDFALVPAAEVAGRMVHPVSGRSLAELAQPLRGSLRAVGVLRGGLAPASGLHYTGPRSLRGARPHPNSPVDAGHRRLPMKFFLDTANLDEIREAHSWGLVDGVTTNPSLIAREGGNFIDTIATICELVQGPVSAEVVSQDAEGMIKEGRLLAQVDEHIVVKVPLSLEGMKATRALSDDGIDVNVTLCFQPAQALLAAKAGAAYISPFMGRLDDISYEGVQLIEQIVQIFSNYPELGTEVLAASIRSSLHITQVALAGADVATIPFKVMKQLIKHPLTDLGNERFLADWAGVPDNDIASQVTRWLKAREER